MAALERAEKDVAFLEAQVARGDFRRSTTKVTQSELYVVGEGGLALTDSTWLALVFMCSQVLHLSMNPARAAMAKKSVAVWIQLWCGVPRATSPRLRSRGGVLLCAAR